MSSNILSVCSLWLLLVLLWFLCLFILCLSFSLYLCLSVSFMPLFLSFICWAPFFYKLNPVDLFGLTVYEKKKAKVHFQNPQISGFTEIWFDLSTSLHDITSVLNVRDNTSNLRLNRCIKLLQNVNRCVLVRHAHCIKPLDGKRTLLMYTCNSFVHIYILLFVSLSLSPSISYESSNFLACSVAAQHAQWIQSINSDTNIEREKWARQRVRETEWGGWGGKGKHWALVLHVHSWMWDWTPWYFPTINFCFWLHAAENQVTLYKNALPEIKCNCDVQNIMSAPSNSSKKGI